jgi:hypothetical protein
LLGSVVSAGELNAAAAIATSIDVLHSDVVPQLLSANYVAIFVRVGRAVGEVKQVQFLSISSSEGNTSPIIARIWEVYAHHRANMGGKCGGQLARGGGQLREGGSGMPWLRASLRQSGWTDAAAAETKGKRAFIGAPTTRRPGRAWCFEVGRRRCLSSQDTQQLRRRQRHSAYRAGCSLRGHKLTHSYRRRSDGGRRWREQR